jgi:hypothetical protein
MSEAPLTVDRDEAKGAGGAAAGKPGGVAVARRIRELREAVTRVIWNEAEGEEAKFHEDNLADLIAEEMLRDNFCAETLNDHVARVCLTFGLSAEAAETWRGLPDPPPEAVGPDDEPDRLSSA